MNDSSVKCDKCGAPVYNTANRNKCNACGFLLRGDELNCPACGNPCYFQEKYPCETIKDPQNKKSDSVWVEPELSPDNVEVQWKWSEYVFTAALNSSIITNGCPKCGNEFEFKPDETSKIKCVNCGFCFNLAEGKKITRPMFPLVPYLKIKNLGKRKINLGVRVFVGPNLSDEWEKKWDGVEPQGTIYIKNQIDPKLIIEQLPVMPKRANLHLNVSFNDKVVWTDTQEIRILPRNQMLWTDEKGRAYFEILRCFVNPSHSAITQVILKARQQLKNITEKTDFVGYQLGNELVIPQIQAIYQTLKDDFCISYTNCQPTFFKSNISQTILFPEEVLNGKAGNCIELTLLFAACMERIGIDPIVYLVDGHAFSGFFTNELAYAQGNWKHGISKDFIEIKELIDKQLLITFEASGIANMSFRQAIEEIPERKKVSQNIFRAVVNLRFLRELQCEKYTPFASRPKED